MVLSHASELTHNLAVFDIIFLMFVNEELKMYAKQ